MMRDAVPEHAGDTWLQSRPWIVGLLCALMPFVWLWTQYPLMPDSSTAPGRVIATTARAYDDAYELRIAYQFVAAGASHVGHEIMQIGDLNWLKQFRNELLAKNVTVVYSAAHPATAFVREMVSRVHLKLAAALAMTAFLLGTRSHGLRVGVYRVDDWSGPVSQLELRFWIWTALLVLFYGTLVVC